MKTLRVVLSVLMFMFVLDSACSQSFSWNNLRLSEICDNKCDTLTFCFGGPAHHILGYTLYHGETNDTCQIVFAKDSGYYIVVVNEDLHLPQFDCRYWDSVFLNHIRNTDNFDVFENDMPLLSLYENKVDSIVVGRSTPSGWVSLASINLEKSDIPSMSSNSDVLTFFTGICLVLNSSGKSSCSIMFIDGTYDKEKGLVTHSLFPSTIVLVVSDGIPRVFQFCYSISMELPKRYRVSLSEEY